MIGYRSPQPCMTMSIGRMLPEAPFVARREVPSGTQERMMEGLPFPSLLPSSTGAKAPTLPIFKLQIQPRLDSAQNENAARRAELFADALKRMQENGGQSQRSSFSGNKQALQAAQAAPLPVSLSLAPAGSSGRLGEKTTTTRPRKNSTAENLEKLNAMFPTSTSVTDAARLRKQNRRRTNRHQLQEPQLHGNVSDNSLSPVLKMSNSSGRLASFVRLQNTLQNKSLAPSGASTSKLGGMSKSGSGARLFLHPSTSHTSMTRVRSSGGMRF